MSVDVSRAAVLRRAYGEASPPDRIKQEAFDHNDRHLRRLARLRTGERPEVRDIWEYTQDLLYTEIDSALFAHVLPFCLDAWRENLRGTHSGYGGFVEHFYLVLADRHVLDEHLTPKQSAAVSEFMRGSILDEIDDQRGLAFQGMMSRPYRWIRALTTYGVLLPDLGRLWTEWWSLSTVGRAVAAVQYVSCLMYIDNENPIFAPWTPDRGGGPPCLWGFEGHLYQHRWLQANIDSLTRALTVRGVSDVLARAVERLDGQSEHSVATEVLADLPLCMEALGARCNELPQLLATTQGAGALLAWGTN
jgi:hypothetical protein